MKLKMPKPVYQAILGVLMLTFVAASCKDKKDDKAKETPKESVTPTPTGNDSNANKPATGDSIKKKPTETGN
jgi:hypothetical protein